MAKFLLTLRSSGPLDAARALPAPAGYLLDFGEDAAGEDGLERWSVDVQLAGGFGDWAKGDAFPALWSYLETALGAIEVRPRGAVSIRSRADPRRAAVTIAYMSDYALHKARDELKQRLAQTIDAATGRMKGDVELKVQG